MNFKEKMMNKMMGNMSTEDKKEMMDKMMKNFFDGMSEEETKEMMGDMMPKMMSMMMMGNGKSSNPMMGMMMNMMGNSENGASSPMDMCKKMMDNISNSSEMAAFATPELRNLFEDWIQQVDNEVLDIINKNDSVSVDTISSTLKISKESTLYILARLAQQNKIDLSFIKTKTPNHNNS